MATSTGPRETQDREDTQAGREPDIRGLQMLSAPRQIRRRAEIAAAPLSEKCKNERALPAVHARVTFDGEDGADVRGNEMAQAPVPLLERLRIFQSRNAEETRAFLHGKNYGFDLSPKEKAGLDTRINGVYLPQSYIGYIQYGAVPVSFSSGRDRSDYWMQLPLRGHLQGNIGRDAVACTPARAAIASPAIEDCRFLTEPDCARIQVSLHGAAVSNQLAALLGEPSGKPISFAAAIDLTQGYGASLARYILMAVTDLERSGSVLWDRLTATAFEQFITTALLLSHPHNHSEALRRLDRPMAPRDVKRAIDYMQAHADASVTMADIVAVSGVPGRTLFKHFKDWKGVSPMRHLRNIRLARVRQELQRAGPDESVTAIAMGMGFTHMGRFSVEYRLRFGESPSQTLKKPCRRHRG
jgi:AraC-like DNA-binding protein